MQTQDTKVSFDAMRNEMGLLLCWIDIARKRGIDSADLEMRDNHNGWTPSQAALALAKELPLPILPTT